MFTKRRGHDRDTYEDENGYEDQASSVEPLRVVKTRTAKPATGKSSDERQALREEVGQYKHVAERLRRELAGKQAEMDGLMEQLVSQKKAKSTMDSLRKQLTQALAEQEAFAKQVAQLTAENQTLTGLVAKRQEDIQETQDLLERTQQELTQTAQILDRSLQEQPDMAQLKQQLFEKTEQLEAERATCQELHTALQAQRDRKTEIAEVLMEAKATAKAMTEKANQEAETIVQGAKERVRKTITEASIELQDISQKASEYHEKLAVIQTETAEIMSELVGKSKYLSKRTLH